MTDEQAALLTSCRRAIALAKDNRAIIEVIQAEGAKIAPIIARGDITQDMFIDAVYESVDGTNLIEIAGDGAVRVAIATGLKRGWANGLTLALSKSSSIFTDELVSPEYLVDGLLQRRFMYSLTAATGTGKTAITVLLAMCVSQGKHFGGLTVTKGNVLYLCAENPDDIRMRWIAQCQHFSISPHDVDNVWFVPGVNKFSEIGDQLTQEMLNRELALVITDTSAAYFEGDDENSNAQVGLHARRMRELLVGLPGGPTVIVNAHPPKNAGPDNLLPRGGGAFLAEVDGNLICRKTDSAIELYWDGKFRGPDFAPLHFMLRTVTHERLVDTKGRFIPTVLAESLSEQGLEDINRSVQDDAISVLWFFKCDPKASIRDCAIHYSWNLRDGSPNKPKVQRILKKLEQEHFISRVLDRWELQPKGTKVLNDADKKT